MVLYWTGSHSSVTFPGCGTTVLLPNKSSGREVQPLAALYPKNLKYPLQGVDPRTHLICTPPGRANPPGSL